MDIHLLTQVERQSIGERQPLPAALSLVCRETTRWTNGSWPPGAQLGERAPVPPPPYVAFAERDRARRARLVSLLLLGVVAWQLCVLVIGIFDPSYGGLVDTTMFAPQLLIFFCVVDVVVVALNRRGQVNQAGLALVAITESPLLALLAFPPHGRLGRRSSTSSICWRSQCSWPRHCLPPWTVFSRWPG